MDIIKNYDAQGKTLTIDVGGKFDFSKVEDFRNAYADLDESAQHVRSQEDENIAILKNLVSYFNENKQSTVSWDGDNNWDFYFLIHSRYIATVQCVVILRKFFYYQLVACHVIVLA